MKLLKFIFAAIIPFNSSAVMLSPYVDWSAHDNIAMLFSDDSYCSGMIVGDNHIITAAHCFKDDSLKNISTYKGNNFVSSYIVNDKYNTDLKADIAIITSSEKLRTNGISFFKSSDNLVNSDVSIYGFGGNKNIGRASLRINDYFQENDSVFADLTTSSYTIGGDSGGAWLNDENEIVAVHAGGHVDVANDGTEKYITYGTNISYSKDFILKNINGWHYPTEIKTKGKTTITVQSLYNSVVTDMAFVKGNLILIPEESSCLNGSIKPFQKCTYTIEGESGSLVLSNEDVINVSSIDNDSGNTGSSSSSGGSLNFLILILLASISIFRKRA